MPASPFPYPPTPKVVPEGLTDYPPSYRSQQNVLLAGMFVFLAYYLALTLFFGGLPFVLLLVTEGALVPRVLGAVASGLMFLFLAKGLFKRGSSEAGLRLEISEAEQPVLWGFIRKVCHEVGAPEPRALYVDPDVNAAVTCRPTLVNLFVRPEQDLVVGLGLVNCTTLSEFKAVVAHEFGHFSQSSYADSYAYVAMRVMGNLVEGEDWFDRLIAWVRAQGSLGQLVGAPVAGGVWVARKFLGWSYKVTALQRLTVSREQEFHADLVAASIAGSDAVAHCLFAVEFGQRSFGRAWSDLGPAADHKLYTRDLYFHQTRAAAILRAEDADGGAGRKPTATKPAAGKDARVFAAPDDEEVPDEDETPPMWRSHPPNADREENVKEQYVAAPADARSPWLLFRDADVLKERMTYRLYRRVRSVPKGAELSDPEEVQTYIDDERAETTYDKKYHGVYDNRPLEPGDLAELERLCNEREWPDDRVDAALAGVLAGARTHGARLGGLIAERDQLDGKVNSQSPPKLKRLLREAQDAVDKEWEWFRTLDRRTYLAHVQAAGKLDPIWRDDLVERYRFQLAVQRLHGEARDQERKVGMFLALLFRTSDPHPDLVTEGFHAFRQGWRTLKTLLADARDIDLPAMKNFVPGERLADFLLDKPMIREMSWAKVSAKWAVQLLEQLEQVKARCARLHFKSLGGILALQERIAADWRTHYAAVRAAEPAVLDAEVIEAEPEPEVIEAEVLDAEEVPPKEPAKGLTAAELHALAPDLYPPPS